MAIGWPLGEGKHFTKEWGVGRKPTRSFGFDARLCLKCGPVSLPERQGVVQFGLTFNVALPGGLMNSRREGCSLPAKAIRVYPLSFLDSPQLNRYLLRYLSHSVERLVRNDFLAS